MQRFGLSLALALALALVLPTTGCYTMTHQVGSGGTHTSVDSERQWYALWGLVPFHKVDSQKLAHGASDYTVKTEQNFLDIVIGFFTGFVSIVPFTVEVER